MTCRDVRELADSFLCEELLTETNHEILRHLETCPTCRVEVDGRRRVRTAVRAAFERSPQLQPSPDFADRLRSHLRQAAATPHPARASGRLTIPSWMPRIVHARRATPPLWLALAAGVVLAIGLAGTLLVTRSPLTGSHASDALAQDAMGDHRNCALKFRLARTPIPLEDAAARFDSAFRLLLREPPDDVRLPGGSAHVVERHSCAYGARRFGHVIMEYQDRVVSLLMTTADGATRPADLDDALPHVIGGPMNGLSVVAVNGPRHAILLVGDLDTAELTQLSRAVSMPLGRQLDVSALPASSSLAALQMPLLTLRASRSGRVGASPLMPAAGAP